ncbi:MAG TPA: S41 family peptidase [Sedimentisphaerales bacterium]|nr:S41 family peptidase [Sedimentisphaerales bacterium]HNU31361.1 S41 family peptidase [Sedimentisphaerales bacterium]
MRSVLRVAAGFVVMCASFVGVRAAQEPLSPAQAAFYQGLEPGVFMSRWLVSDPFPVFDGPPQPDDPNALRQAFDRDLLTEHGGEAQIRPTTEIIHERNGLSYRWRKVDSPTDIVDLVRRFGYKEYVISYAWAQIDMPAETSALLGVGSDDAVKVWLNGKLVHENWTDRAAKEDDDLVPVQFRAGPNQLLLKVQNGRQSWGFACRMMDAKALGEKLLAALHSGDAAGAELSLSHGAELSVTDQYGFTALQVARMRGLAQIAELLLAKGADANAPMPTVGTPVGFLDLLWNSLKDNYPMMEYAGAFDESWYEACKERIQGMDALYEALPIMDAMLVQRLNDYHTSLYWDGKRDLVGPPIRAGWIENQVVVLQCAKDLGIAPGDIVLEIDGADAKERFERTWPEAFGATSYARARSACRTILEGEPDTQIKLKLSSATGETYEKVLTRGGYRGGYGGRGEPVISSREIDDRVGCIRIRSWGGFSDSDFDKLLEPLRDKPCLIVDVRDNGGGADELAETVISRFITRKVVASISFQRKPGTDTYEKFINVVEPRGPWCYPGKVAVLTNEGCASACEHFVSGMFEAGALLVGTPTIGACGWSNGIDLPAGVTLRCSLTFPLHGKMPSPLHGIEPHHLVTPTIADIRAGRDTVLERAILLLNP